MTVDDPIVYMDRASQKVKRSRKRLALAESGDLGGARHKMT